MTGEAAVKQERQRSAAGAAYEADMLRDGFDVVRAAAECKSHNANGGC